MALLNVVAMRVVIRLRATRTAKLRADNARLTNTAYTGLQLIETMKATGGEDGYFRKWAGQHATTLEEQQRLGVPSAWLGVVAPTLATLNSALILWIGGMRAIEGGISVGLLVAFQALVTRFTAPITRPQRRGGPHPGLRRGRGPAEGRRELPGRPALRAAPAPATRRAGCTAMSSCRTSPSATARSTSPC